MSSVRSTIRHPVRLVRGLDWAGRSNHCQKIKFVAGQRINIDIPIETKSFELGLVCIILYPSKIDLEMWFLSDLLPGHIHTGVSDWPHPIPWSYWIPTIFRPQNQILEMFYQVLSQNTPNTHIIYFTWISIWGYKKYQRLAKKPWSRMVF